MSVAASALAGPLVQARAVVRRFGGLTAVDGADLTVEPGEVVGLLGANGAGKTTLIRILLGLLRPTAGEVRLFGAPPSRAARRRLGYVSQGLGLWDDLTVAENLGFAGGAFGAGSAPAAAAPLDDELEAARDTLVRDLSLGLRRRLAFAAALAHAPELLVLDEPTSGVEPLARARLWDTIRRAVDAGAGALVTTHYMDEAEQCDRLVVMAAGRVVGRGTIDELVGDATSVRVDAEAWEAAFVALDERGLPLSLAGRSIRVPGGDAAGVRQALAARRVAASVSTVPATFEERFVAMTLAVRSAS